jgi:hypothetical protein
MGECSSHDAASHLPPIQKAGALAWAMLLVLCLSVLGQGERCEVDPRFASPGATLHTFWEALRAGDAETASQCIEDGGYTGPFPGMVWFMPPSHDLRLEAVHSLPVRRGRVMVNYEVHYFALGVSEELSFRTENHLVQLRGEWRIAPPFGNVSTQEWVPLHRLSPI